MNKRKVLFVASTGGHLKELMQLEDMFLNCPANKPEHESWSGITF